MMVTREDWRREAWEFLASLRRWNRARRAGRHWVEARRRCAEAALRCRARARGAA